MKKNVKVALAIVFVFVAMYLFTVLLPYLLEGGEETVFEYGTILFLTIIGFIALILVTGKVTKRKL
ncbi:MAG TPA: hypothetical protein VJZ32_01620 [Candidatus Bathyarchaeia archaeon]|nr:hypothetical protein [Candidatus Bathyarchaeia archaeon]